MDDSGIEWGCCQLDDKNEKSLQCDGCKKSFHYSCLALNLSRELTSWTCPICTSMAPKEKNNDNTPVRFNPNTTARTTKRQALQSPPDTSAAPVTESEVRTIVEDVMEDKMETFLTKITLNMRMMLNAELKSLREEIKDVRESVSFISHQYEEILREHKEDKQKIKELQESNNSMSSAMKDMSTRLNTLEQQTRASNLEIQCVPQKKNENLINIVTKLGKVINSEVKEEEISHCTRVMKSNSNNNRPKSIIVQFITPRLRDSFLAATINFNRSKSAAEKLNTLHLGFDGDKAPIYVTEHLSLANKALHAATRIKAKEKGYKHVWVRNGRIYVRKTDFTQYILIKDTDSLNKLI